MTTALLPTPGDPTQANTWGTMLIAWLQALTGDVFNVLTDPYNATGDGVTDDTAGIQAALTAGAGGTVFFPAGTYKITAHLHISASHTHVVFAPGAKIQIGANANCDGFIIDNGLHDVSFAGMEFDGNQANQSSGTCKAIQGAGDVTDFLEQNCWFHDLYGTSSYCNYFYGSGYARFRFLNNRVGSKGRTFAMCIGMDDLLIDGLSAVQGRGNIQWGGGARCKITNVTQYAPSHDAVSGEQQMIVIAGDASLHDAKVDTTDWEVTNCTIINGYGDCLWIGPSSQGRVIGCRIRTEGDVASADCCSSLNGADEVTYLGCEFSHAGTAGIAIDHLPSSAIVGSENINIMGCQIHDCGTRTDGATDGYRSGVLIQPYSVNVSIEGCQIYDNDEYPICCGSATGVAGIVVRDLRSWGNDSGDAPAITGSLGLTWSMGDARTYGAVISYGPDTEGTAAGRTFIDNDGAGAGRLVVKGADASTSGTLHLHQMESDGGGDYDAIVPQASGTVSVSNLQSHNYAAGTTAWTMTGPEAAGTLFIVTNASGPADAIFPAAVPGKQFSVYNNSGQAITFKVTGQAGVASTNAKYSVWTMNATDCVKIYEQP